MIRARVTRPARIAVDRDHALSVDQSSSGTYSTAVIKEMKLHPAARHYCQGTNDARHLVAGACTEMRRELVNHVQTLVSVELRRQVTLPTVPETILGLVQVIWVADKH